MCIKAEDDFVVLDTIQIGLCFDQVFKSISSLAMLSNELLTSDFLWNDFLMTSRFLSPPFQRQ